MKLPIYFTFDNNYVVPAAVAIYSLLYHAKPGVHYDIYVLHEDITEQNQQVLQEIVARFIGTQLTFIHTQGFLMNEWINGNFEGHQERGKFTRDAVIKCFGARFIPQYKKIIYSDVDVIFVDDISELYDVNLDGKYVAGVRDAFMEYDRNELSHLPRQYYEKLKDCYIAGGIFVLNADMIRRDHLEDKMIETIKDSSIPKRWPDQDILSIACDMKVGYIPLSYISYPHLINFLKGPNFPSHYSRAELWDSILKPKIIHFAGPKPWKEKTNYDSLWWSYYHYLNLQRVRTNTLLKPAEDWRNAALRKKVKKYKRLTFFTLALLILSFVFLAVFVLKN